MRFICQSLSDSIIDVIPFRDNCEIPIKFPSSNYESMIDHLRNIDYDGGSNLGSINVTKVTKSIFNKNIYN